MTDRAGRIRLTRCAPRVNSSNPRWEAAFEAAVFVLAASIAADENKARARSVPVSAMMFLITSEAFQIFFIR